MLLDSAETEDFVDGFFNHGLFIDEYKVQCKIGEGSFSEVLKCQNKKTGAVIAAKQLKKPFKSIKHAAELPEIIAMRKVTHHPNILQLLEAHFDEGSGKVTLVFELMDMSLCDLMKQKRRSIPEGKAKKYLYQIIKGVEHIHDHGIFHRDIKPENILVKGDSLKLSDLGSIKGVYTRHPHTEYISTRWYRSPECILTSGYYGPKMDIWAIGCVFYELLTLKPLFPGSNEIDQITRINNVLGTPSPRLLAKFRRQKGRNTSVCFPAKKGTGLNHLIPFITDEGREILKQMLIYDPEARINIRRLIDHKYFSFFREAEALACAVKFNTMQNVNVSRRPSYLGYLTHEKRKRLKRKVPKKPHEAGKAPDHSSSESDIATIPNKLKTTSKTMSDLNKKMTQEVKKLPPLKDNNAAKPQRASSKDVTMVTNSALEKLKVRLSQRLEIQNKVLEAQNMSFRSHQTVLKAPPFQKLPVANRLVYPVGNQPLPRKTVVEKESAPIGSQVFPKLPQTMLAKDAWKTHFLRPLQAGVGSNVKVEKSSQFRLPHAKGANSVILRGAKSERK